MRSTRDKLMMPAYVALELLRWSDPSDRARQDPARNSLAALLDYMLVAMRNTGRGDISVIEDAIDALRPICEVYDAGGPFCCSQDDYQLICRAVGVCDITLGTMRNQDIVRAVLEVDQMLVDAQARENAVRASSGCLLPEEKT